MAKILIIDDDAAVRLSARMVLEHAGHVVDEADDGNAGIARVALLLPDLILTDIVMPNKEGIETIRELRGGGFDGPIIAMSGGGRLDASEILDLAAKLGADACLSKPFKRAALLAKIDQCLAIAAEEIT